MKGHTASHPDIATAPKDRWVVLHGPFGTIKGRWLALRGIFEGPPDGHTIVGATHWSEVE